MRDGPCVDLVHALQRRAILLIVHSGLPAQNKPADLVHVPWLTKPTDKADVMATLHALVGTP